MSIEIGPFQTFHQNGTTKKPILVLFHGYGANSLDLAGLRSELFSDPLPEMFCPEGPLEVPIGPHMVGRAWLPIEPERFQRMPIHVSKEPLPQGFKAMAKQANEFLSLISKEGTRPYILGGFSQGAMMSLELAVSATYPPEKVLLFSTGGINWQSVKERIGRLKEIPVWQSHGTQDAVLAYEDAVLVSNSLASACSHFEFFPFQGGHEIPRAALRAAKNFLAL